MIFAIAHGPRGYSFLAQLPAVAVSTRLIFAVALMSQVSVFTFELSTHGWQADMHMYLKKVLSSLLSPIAYPVLLYSGAAPRLPCITWALNFDFPPRQSIPVART